MYFLFPHTVGQLSCWSRKTTTMAAVPRQVSIWWVGETEWVNVAFPINFMFIKQKSRLQFRHEYSV